MIRVLVDGERWQTLGSERDRGVLPVAPAPTWDGWGSASLSFNIARDPSLTHPDLAAFTPIEYAPYGDLPSWGGYIMDTPAAGGDGLTVNSRGWQFALDDDPYVDAYVHANQSDYADLRSFPGSFLYGANGGEHGWNASGQVNTGANLSFGWPQGAVIPPGAGVGVGLDLGPLGRGAKRVVLNVTGINQNNGNFLLYVRGNDLGPSQRHSGGNHEDALPGAVVPNSPFTFSGSFSTPRRYVSVFLFCPGGGTAGLDHTVTINSIQVFTDLAYEAGNASALRATQVLANALSKVPVLDQSTALLAQTSLPIPAYGGVKQERTARQDIDSVNAYHRFITRIRPDRRLEFRQRFAYPTLEANTRRAGVDFVDATVNSGEDVYNAVSVRGKTGSGADVAVRLTSTDVGIRNVLDRRGRVRSKVLEVQAPTDAGICVELGKVWLRRYARTPLKGTLTIAGARGLYGFAEGGFLQAGYVGSRVGEGVLLSNLMDPDTGDRGRVAITAGASYNEADDVVTLAVDNTRDDLEGLLARMGVVAGQ